MHSDKKVRHCHYFRNNIFCPFEELGCKFLHTNRIIDNTEDKLSERKMILTIQDILKAILKSSNSVLLLLKKRDLIDLMRKKTRTSIVKIALRNPNVMNATWTNTYKKRSITKLAEFVN